MTFIDLFSQSGYLCVSRALIQEIGLKPAILLSELCSEHDYYDKQDRLEYGYFYSTIENIEQQCGLSRREQEPALKVLQDRGLVEVKVMGVPATRHFKILTDGLTQLLTDQFAQNALCTKSTNQFAQNVQTSMHEMYKLDCTKSTTNNTNNNTNNDNKNNTKTDKSDKTIKRNVLDTFKDDIYNRYEFNLFTLIVKYYEFLRQSIKLPVSKFKEMLNKLEEDCKGDIKLFQFIIQNAYDNNYKSLKLYDTVVNEYKKSNGKPISKTNYTQMRECTIANVQNEIYEKTGEGF